MTPFKAPVDDILFCLRDVARADSLADWDDDLAADIIAAFGAFAEGVIAPLDEPGDAQGCQLENGRVRMPDGFGAAFAQLSEDGWQGLGAPEEFGGMAQNHLIAAAVSEIFTGANPSLQMITSLAPGAISTLLVSGSDEQQATWIPRLASGEALATMCLTEPGAGSDLGRVRTKAKRDGDGWRIEGEKIFISGGDQDMSRDILHLVLARTGALEDGVRGLSLFATSRAAAGDTIKITRIEKKLGLHASPTCQMAFDGAPAELVGAEGDGLMAMFTMMNHARIDVALQGVAHAARAHHIAASYAAERVQGRGPNGPVTIDTHADVRRMLDEQAILSMGARAMCHIALVEMEKGTRPALIDFLTPVLKVFCTDAGIKAADLGIQILGGYGYLTEYRVSQTWRDARITAIYEGANGIHATATATRGLRVSGGKGADQFEALIGELAGDRLEELLGMWRAARTDLTVSATPTTGAHDFMELTGALFLRAVWHRIQDAATETSRNDSLIRLARILKSRPIPKNIAGGARARCRHPA